MQHFFSFAAYSLFLKKRNTTKEIAKNYKFYKKQTDSVLVDLI